MTPAQEIIVIEQATGAFPPDPADLARWHFGASGCLDAPDYLPIGSCVKDCMGVYPADVRRSA